MDMKLRTTRKAIGVNHYRVIGAGYCELQHLLKFREAMAYSSGIYGWNCDYYNIDGVVIATGYRGVWSQNTHASEKLIRDYDDKAHMVLNDYYTSGSSRWERLDQLLSEFVAKAIS
ncbi:hypothetical protein CMI37_02790 [Candidatus Pacearchaeota archaeon]|nr:hypothetical protein [Candidatus Pacearchaeota archaeon]